MEGAKDTADAQGDKEITFCRSLNESQEFIDKNRSLCDSWKVGLKKSQEDPLVFQQGESFTQSRKMCSKMINQKEKNEKLQLTNDDIKGKVLHCKKCDYQTPKLKPSKAKQKLSAHEYSRHNKEDLPKAKLEAAENNPEEDCNNLPMVQFAAQKEVLHDIL